MNKKIKLSKIQITGLKNPILIKKKENLFYLTGRSLENRAEEFLLITPPPQPSPHRMHSGGGRRVQAVAFGYGLEKIDWFGRVDRLKNIGKYLKGYRQLDIEYGFTYAEGRYIQSKIKDYRLKIKIQPTRSAVDVMRQIKTADEIVLVRKSMQIVEKVFMEVRKRLRRAGPRPATTEMELAQFIQKKGLQLGAHDLSFPAIVASGANAAIPHHVPTNKKLKPGESIIIDFGFSAGGGSASGGKYKANYCSDFTRTVFLKTVPKRLEIAYNQVEKAYNESIEYITACPGMPLQGKPSNVEARRGEPGNVVQASGLLPNKAGRLVRRSLMEVGGPALQAGDIYQKAVSVLAEKNLDKYFIHSLGHGTGLEIHELPNLSPKSKDTLENGMVFSIEPGVYLPKLGGVRIEDLVYLEAGRVKKFINVSTRLMDNII